MRPLAWLVRAVVFLGLFAFALNNQQEVAVHWFFGMAWHAPLVIVALVAFALGCAIGVLAMVPSWWRHRRVARRHRPEPAPPNTGTAAPPAAPAEQPPRDGI